MLESGTEIKSNMGQFVILLLDMFVTYVDLHLSRGLAMNDNPRYDKQNLHIYLRETWFDLIKLCNEEDRIRFLDVPENSDWLSQTIQRTFPDQDGEWCSQLNAIIFSFTDPDRIEALQIISTLNELARQPGHGL